MILQIIDDEVKEANCLKKRALPYKFEQIYISHSCKDAIVSINQYKPNVIIADYKLGKSASCVDVLKKVSLIQNAVVIVITDYFEEEVLRKFDDLVPIQFLNKSCSDLEFMQAILYAKKTSSNKADIESNKADIEAINESLTDRIFVKIGDKVKAINLTEILFFEVDGKYLNVHLEENKYSIRYSLSAILKKLPDNFLRTHGSFIVNIDKIEELIPSEQLIRLRNKSVPFTRGFKKELMDKFFFA